MFKLYFVLREIVVICCQLTRGNDTAFVQCQISFVQGLRITNRCKQFISHVEVHMESSKFGVYAPIASSDGDMGGNKGQSQLIVMKNCKLSLPVLKDSIICQRLIVNNILQSAPR